MAKRWRRLLVWLAAVAGAVLATAVAAFVVWGLDPLEPSAEALTALESDATVRVEAHRHWDFTPTGAEPTVGVVLYPGGHVDARAYAPLARRLSEQGFLVALVPMPLSLAVLSPAAADDALAAHPEIETWVIAGHSLGGAMAARYADRHDEIDGLVLLGAYPESSIDLRDNRIVAASLVGTNDTVVDPTRWEDGLTRLPDGSDAVRIEGGNHAQWGDYGEQPGDSPATITPEEQQAAAVDAVIAVTGSAR